MTGSLKKKVCHSWSFSSNIVNPSVLTILKRKDKSFFAVFSISDNLKHAVVGLSASQNNLWKMEFSLSIKRAGDRE